MIVPEILSKIIDWIKTGIPHNVKSANLRTLLTNMTIRMDVQETGRLKIIKASGNTSLDQQVGDRVTGIIEDTFVVNAIYLGGNVSLLASYLIITPGENPTENEYPNIAAMLADQENQTGGFYQYVEDATDDPTVEEGDAVYYYLGTTNETLSDYIRITDGELSAGINTESNLEKQFGAGAITITAGANTTPQEICDHINSVGFTVTAGQMIFLALTVKKTISGQGYWYRQKYFFKRNNIVGTWGTGSTNGLIVPSDLSLYYDVVQAVFEDSDDNVFIDLGDIDTTPIHTYLEDYAGDPIPGLTDNILADDGSIYYFNCTAGGILVTYKFIGTLPKTIGVSTFDIGDFQVFASSGDDGDTGLTAEEIKTLYESNANTNAFTDALLAKLNSLDKTETISFVISSPDQDIATGDTVSYFDVPYAFTLQNYWIGAKVAPTGSGAIVRVKKNGTLADSAGATISSGNLNSIGNNPTITTASFAKGDRIQPNISQVGSTAPGQYIILYLEILKT